jgi:apolipoprotein D and lipocalin family protein
MPTFRHFISLTFLIASLIGIVSASHADAPMQTVANVDLTRYLGKWFEVSSIPNRFQSMCVADTQAEYKKDEDIVRVINRCRKSDGSVTVAKGRAKIVEGSNNSKLRVSFFWPFYGNYWILALDPDYRWVLVGEPDRKYGWILSRSPQLDALTVNQILDKAVTLGYERTAFKVTPQTSPLD